ncbi:hypothetical protein BJX62DRAFT_206706 [Aspergillus germanicus]
MQHVNQEKDLENVWRWDLLMPRLNVGPLFRVHTLGAFVSIFNLLTNMIPKKRR